MAARCNLGDARSMTVRAGRRYTTEGDANDARTHRKGMKIIVLLLFFYTPVREPLCARCLKAFVIVKSVLHFRTHKHKGFDLYILL